MQASTAVWIFISSVSCSLGNFLPDMSLSTLGARVASRSGLGCSLELSFPHLWDIAWGACPGTSGSALGPSSCPPYGGWIKINNARGGCLSLNLPRCVILAEFESADLLWDRGQYHIVNYVVGEYPEPPKYNWCDEIMVLLLLSHWPLQILQA